MSSLGTLSHHYTSSADLAKAVNQAVTALKQQFYGIVTSSQGISEAQTTANRRYLAELLTTLLNELEPNSDVTENEELSPIPASIVERLRQEHQGIMAHYIEDVTFTRDRLIHDDQILDEDDIKLLDGLAATASLDTTEVFRRMWRK